MTTTAQHLRALGFRQDQIAAATVNGKPLADVDKAKPSKLDGMNKWEAAYALDLRERERRLEICWWKFGAIKLQLAKRTWYTPDFAVGLMGGRIQMVEIKGFLRDDAAVKFKCARETYPQFEWIMLRRVKGIWVAVNI